MYCGCMWDPNLLSTIFSPEGSPLSFIIIFFIAHPLSGNGSFSWEWKRSSDCYWCCCKRSWFSWHTDCCSLSVAPFSWSKLRFCGNRLHMLGSLILLFYYFHCRFIYTEVAGLHVLPLMAALLHWFLLMIKQSFLRFVDHYPRCSSLLGSWKCWYNDNRVTWFFSF